MQKLKDLIKQDVWLKDRCSSNCTANFDRMRNLYVEQVNRNPSVHGGRNDDYKFHGAPR